jgi:hypothetical protein
MRIGIRVALLVSAMALASCGSGSNDSSTTPIAVTPAPAPTPTPAPTPPPTPAPSPTAPTGNTISTEAGSALIGALQYDAGNGQTARWATDYSGRFPPADGWLATNSLVSAGFNPDYTRAIYALSTVGIDRDSQLLISSTAPAGATVVSPLTGLIGNVGSQSTTRAALQLGTTYAGAADSDLLTTSGVGTGSGDILAANVRTVLLWRVVDASMFGLGALAQTYTPFNLVNRNTEIGTFVRANPSVQLYTQAGAEQLLRATGQRAIDDATFHALAHLITIYAQATAAIASDRSQATRYMLGIEGYLDELIRGLRSNQGTPAYAARVEALTAADVAAGVATFALPAFTSGRTFFAGPDFDFLAPGTSGSRPNFNQNRIAPASSPATYGWAENDFTFNPTSLNFDADYYVARIVSVTVPAEFAGKISASAQSPTQLSYTALAGFRGTAYFDYLVDDGAGHQATARFFLIVR